MFKVYPKVKVRQDVEEEEEEEEEEEFQRIYLKDFQSPSNSPQHKYGYKAPLVRVPRSPIRSISDTKISSKAKAGKDDNKKVAEGNKVNKKVAEAIKPTSVLPPRAVLSSPENDLMLGTKNKTKTKTAQTSGLKNHKSSDNTHVKCKKLYEQEKKTSSWSWKP